MYFGPQSHRKPNTRQIITAKNTMSFWNLTTALVEQFWNLTTAFVEQFSSKRAKTRQGPPLPPEMNMGAAYTVKHFVGSLSMWATFSSPGMFSA